MSLEDDIRRLPAAGLPPQAFAGSFILLDLIGTRKDNTRSFTYATSQIVRRLGEIMSRLGEGSKVYRIGGDEFLVTDPPPGVCEKLRVSPPLAWCVWGEKRAEQSWDEVIDETWAQMLKLKTSGDLWASLFYKGYSELKWASLFYKG